MPVEKLIVPKKLVEYLDKEVCDTLAACEIFKIGNYGWLDEYTPDPELVGHAMWQTEPPFEPDWEHLFGEGPARHRPTEYEKLLSVSGADFEGLMELARLSVGLAVFHQRLAEDRPFDDNHYFWLHYINAVVLLNIASDRLREFFVMAFFRINAKTYERKSKEHKWYQTPFIEAKGSENQALDEILTKLCVLTEVIYRHRQQRNSIVHDVATRIGRQSSETIRDQQNRYDSSCVQDFTNETLDFDEVIKRSHEAQVSALRETQSAREQIVSWYKTLVQASSYVFETEHLLRRSRNNSREGNNV